MLFPDIESLWRFLPLGYLLTVLLEGPILYFGLSARHSQRDRLLYGFWLTACTYPIVVLVMPILVASLGLEEWTARVVYLSVAETFAPAAECALLWLISHPTQADQPVVPRSVWLRDFAVVTLANLVSFIGGLWIVEMEWFQNLINIKLPE
jgi:hypothetical protein